MAPLMDFRWTRKRALAASALLLGLVAIPGHPIPGHTVRIDTQELAEIVSTKVDHVSVQELADAIIRGDSDYRLIDVRTPEEFAAFQLPSSENVPLTELPDYGLGRNEKIVLCSEGGIHSAQAWMLLRAQGYHGVYILSGGLDAWKDEVMYPVAPADSTPAAISAFRKAVEVARHFGGAPRRAAAPGAEPAVFDPAPASAARTQAAVPVTQDAGKKTAPGRKPKEGC